MSVLRNAHVTVSNLGIKGPTAWFVPGGTAGGPLGTQVKSIVGGPDCDRGLEFRNN